MLSIEDCLAFCDLSKEEIAIIAEREHVPDIIAAEIGHFLLRQPSGVRRLKRIMLDGFAEAKARGDREKALTLRAVFRHFVIMHPRRLDAPRAMR